MLNRAAAAVVLAFVFAAACSEQESPGAPSAPIPEGAPAAAAPVVHGARPVASAADARGGQPRVHNATMGYATVEVDVSARDGGLDVTWSGVSEHAEQVRVRAFVGAGRDAVHDETVGASATSATISGLTNGVGYQVQVDALGPGGFGLGGGRGAGTPRSGVVSLPRPRQVVGVRVSPVDGGLRVSWDPLGGSSHNQYRVDAVAQGYDHRRRYYVDSGTTQLTADRLRNGLIYAVTVRALHRTGGPDGADSAAVEGTPRGNPMMIWDAPLYPAGPVFHRVSVRVRDRWRSEYPGSNYYLAPPSHGLFWRMCQAPSSFPSAVAPSFEIAYVGIAPLRGHGYGRQSRIDLQYVTPAAFGGCTNGQTSGKRLPAHVEQNLGLLVVSPNNVSAQWPLRFKSNSAYLVYETSPHNGATPRPLLDDLASYRDGWTLVLFDRAAKERGGWGP